MSVVTLVAAATNAHAIAACMCGQRVQRVIPHALILPVEQQHGEQDASKEQPIEPPAQGSTDERLAMTQNQPHCNADSMFHCNADSMFPISLQALQYLTSMIDMF